MSWLILNADGEIDMILADFDPDLEDMTNRTAIERDVPDWAGSKWDVATQEFVVDMDYYWDELRAERDRRIADTDWWERPSVIAQTDPELYTARMAYCQALRDLPENTVDPRDPDWPVVPA